MRAGPLPWTVWAIAAVAVPCALVLAALGVEVLRAPGELRADDARFQAALEREQGLWDVGFLPGGGSEKLLDLEDDVSFRELAAAYVEVEPGEVDYAEAPELESLRETTESELERRGEEEPDRVRRARLLTLYGVMRLDERPADVAGREAAAREAEAAFRGAIDLDPTNVDAMTNLEALLDTHGEVLGG